MPARIPVRGDIDLPPFFQPNEVPKGVLHSFRCVAQQSPLLHQSNEVPKCTTFLSIPKFSGRVVPKCTTFLGKADISSFDEE
jgi:hypothetical protein